MPTGATAAQATPPTHIKVVMGYFFFAALAAFFLRLLLYTL